MLQWGKVTIISRGGEISITGGGEEMVRGYVLLGFFFPFFFLYHIFFV